MDRSKRTRGLFYVIIGAIFWGVGGTVSQKLFQQYFIEVGWLVTVRLLISGILLLTVQFFTRDRRQILDIWKNKNMSIKLVVFGLLGMLAVQYTYMASIKHGNAAVATLLQYLAPVFIIFYSLLLKKSVLTRKDVMTVTLAIIGCFLLLTNGSISKLSVPKPAIFWGVLAGISLAFYTLYAVSLLEKYDSLVVVGWAMIIGGFLFSFINPPWVINTSNFTFESSLYLLFVIIFGTMIAFWFYIESLQYLTPKETSCLGTLEPLAAVLTTVFWLKESFGRFQWLGTICIIIMILLMALYKESSSINKNDTINVEID